MRCDIDVGKAENWFSGQLPRTLDLVFGSPPYALKGGRYKGGIGDYPDTADGWAAWMHSITARACGVCNGFVIWVADSPREDGGVYVPAVERLKCHLSDDSDLVLRTPQVWHKNGPPGPRGYPSHHYEQIVVCHHKSATPTVNMDVMMHPAKFTSGAFRQRKADGDRSRLGTKVQKGTPAKPGDVIQLEPSDFNRFTVGGGSMGRVGANGKIDMQDDKLACSGEAPFPWKLADWYVRGYSPAGGTVADPFVGTGTTALAAIMAGRNFRGCDIRESQVDLSRRRIDLWLNQQPQTEES